MFNDSVSPILNPILAQADMIMSSPQFSDIFGALVGDTKDSFGGADMAVLDGVAQANSTADLAAMGMGASDMGLEQAFSMAEAAIPPEAAAVNDLMGAFKTGLQNLGLFRRGGRR